MGGNRSLTRAQKAKNDEFYTQYMDIEAELPLYAEHFRDKTVYCNCDKPGQSEFWRFFVDVFRSWGIRTLIATCYTPDGQAFVYELGEKFMKRKLSGDGDFRSGNCVELLKRADIVVTNPPFSLFREYVSLMMEHDKKFLVIGNLNAVTYKEIFPLIMDNRLWLGHKIGDMAFKVPADSEPRATRYWQDESGQKWRSMGNVCWFTNLEHDKRHMPLLLASTYKGQEDKYPKYDNFDAINVDRVAEIPKDYDGLMGVPITFLDKYCPDQFEIAGVFNHGQDGPWDFAACNVGGAAKYKRIAIKRK